MTALDKAIEAWRGLPDADRAWTIEYLPKPSPTLGGLPPGVEAALALLRAAAEPETKESHLVTVARLADALGVHPEADAAIEALIPKFTGSPRHIGIGACTCKVDPAHGHLSSCLRYRP